MADQFGVQLQELAKIQNDFHKINDRMQQMGSRVEQIKAAVEKAAATDLTAGGLLGVVNFVAVATKVAFRVREIAEQAQQLQDAKKQLTDGMAEDAGKLKAVIAEYAAAEKKHQEELGRIHGNGQDPKGPHTGIDGTGGGSGSKGGSGSGSGGGGGHGTPSSPHTGGSDTSGSDGSGITLRPGGKHDGPKIKDHSTGDWKTTISGGGWDSWSDHRHPRNGEGAGVLAKPHLEGASDERRAMVDRAMERVERKLGYSQCSFTNGYRVDCSGFVSAAWGLGQPGTTTGPLISEGSGIAHHISKGSMLPGDAMVVHNGSSQHVVLFGGWADAQHTKMIILEDSGSRGCVSREVALSAFSSYTAIRKNGM